MIGKLYITEIIGEDTTLVDVIRQVKSQKDATEFIAIIDSQGGYVDEGFAIYEFLKNLDKPVHTYAKRAYSIASVIYMAGQRRLVDANAQEVLMIHLPWQQPNAGNFDEITREIEGLKEAENRLINFYSTEIDLPKDTIKSLLSNETFLSADEALEMGFATEIKTLAPAMAKLSPNNKKENRNDLNSKKNTNLLKSIALALGIKAELILQDASGVELVFPELTSADLPFIDDKATVDGKPAEGEFIIPSIGQTLKFQGGVITEMEIPADDEQEPETEDEAVEDSENEENNAETSEEANDSVEDALLEAITSKIDSLNATLETTSTKLVELENKLVALTKSIGSNYQASQPKNVTSATIKASGEEKPKFSITRKANK